MPANLPPDYHFTEKKLRTARSPEEKLAILERMLTLVPKHKGTERLQKDLKVKIAKLKKLPFSKKKSQKESSYYVPKEGAGQLAISGPPNSGKSSLLNLLTNARVRVGDYSFVTKIPQPAMMPYQDIFIQLIDTPPLTKDFSPPWLKEILLMADGLLVVFDLTKPKEIEDFFEIFKKVNIGNKKKILIGNKIDLSGAKESFLNLKKKYPLESLSCQEKTGLEDLKEKIFHLLEIVRIYSKKPNQEPDFGHPFTCKKGTRLIDLAGQIHWDLIENFKYARLFGKKLKTPLIIGKDYILKDGDIVEIHG